ncbi:MAG: hypothetical protein JSS35_11015 [Proteobacteria bacterium]|nr:hypothetical protein [Pseudomonadota bacterium]
MIALLLATQLSAQAFVAPPTSPDRVRPANELVRVLPGRQACVNDPPGHMEVSLKATPSALYRHGDRPARGLRRWADYPDGALCAVEAAR